MERVRRPLRLRRAPPEKSVDPKSPASRPLRLRRAPPEKSVDPKSPASLLASEARVDPKSPASKSPPPNGRSSKHRALGHVSTLEKYHHHTQQKHHPHTLYPPLRTSDLYYLGNDARCHRLPLTSYLASIAPTLILHSHSHFNSMVTCRRPYEQVPVELE